MTKELEVIKHEIVQKNPMELSIEFLKNDGCTLETLKEILALQKEHDAYQAKKAFVRAMAKFKTVPIEIIKDKDNTQYNSKYSSIGSTVNSCLPRMGECGLSHKWEFEKQTEQKLITGWCIVTHEGGHSDKVSMTAPIDTSGSKNPIQQIKSTRTYIKIETFASLMGIASSETDLDDDGNASGKQTKCISEEQYIELRETIESIKGLTEKDFLKMAGCEKIEEIHAVNFGKAKMALSERAKVAT